MFDPRAHSDVSPDRFRLFRRGANILGPIAVLVLALAFVLLPDREAGTDPLDAIEADIQTGLGSLARASPGNAISELTRFRRRVRRQQARLARGFPRMALEELSDPERHRAERTREELARLRECATDWETRMRAASGPGRDEDWTEICVEALMERTRWPLTDVVRVRTLPRPRNLWFDFQEGVSRGTFWPVYAALNLVRRQPATMGPLRRALFPFRRLAALGPLYLAGLGFGAVGLGYGFCWLGMRFNRTWASYAGLIYFAYVLVFSVCLTALFMGVMP